MERVAWTDERLQERFDGIDRRFDAVDHRFDEVDRRFGEVDRRLGEMDRKFERRFDRLDDEVGSLRHAMLGLHTVLNRAAVGIIIGLGGVIVTLLAKGG
jgi:hypothetical protein